MAVVIGMMLSVFIGGILVGKLEDVIDDQRAGASSEFNDTMDQVVSYTWITFTFLAIGILLVGGAWILNQTGLLG